jgi:hypothetical protein
MTEGEATDVFASVVFRDVSPSAPSGAGPEPTIVVDYDTGRLETFACELGARLSGGGFDVEPDVPVLQSMIQRDQVDWLWHVTPQETGVPERQLHLAVAPYAVYQGAQMPGAETPFNASIRVTAKLKNRSWYESMNAVLDDPIPATALTVVLTVVLAGVSVTSIRAWLKRRRSGQSDNESGQSATGPRHS